MRQLRWNPSSPVLSERALVCCCIWVRIWWNVNLWSDIYHSAWNHWRRRGMQCFDTYVFTCLDVLRMVTAWRWRQKEQVCIMTMVNEMCWRCTPKAFGPLTRAIADQSVQLQFFKVNVWSTLLVELRKWWVSAVQKPNLQQFLQCVIQTCFQCAWNVCQVKSSRPRCTSITMQPGSSYNNNNR